MPRAVVVLAGLCVGLSPAASQAQGTEAPSIIIEELPEFRYLDVIKALDDAGYRIMSVSSTLLNRVRIRAQNDQHLREVIVSRSTGTVLRDALLETYD
jgi:hypothetical protein